MGKQEDIWYAVNATRIIHAPKVTLETFGATTIRYHLLSELMDEVNKVRLRAGSVFSERPQIVTPTHLASQLLEGFGDKAREYVEWLRSNGDMIRILRYGLQFRKEKMAEHLYDGTVDNVAAELKDKIEQEDDGFSAVVIGADELWEVSLLKFVIDFIQQSAQLNIEELEARSKRLSVPSSDDIRKEIEIEFAAASLDPSRIDGLGKKLQKYGKFEAYEDRFYSLLRRLT